MELLLELATMSHEATNDASHLTSVACSCLIALVIARGDTGKLLSALAALLMCPQFLAVQPIHVIFKNIFGVAFELNVMYFINLFLFFFPSFFFVFLIYFLKIYISM